MHVVFRKRARLERWRTSLIGTSSKTETAPPVGNEVWKIGNLPISRQAPVVADKRADENLRDREGTNLDEDRRSPGV